MSSSAASAGAADAVAAAGANDGSILSPPSTWQQFSSWLWNLFHSPDDQQILFGRSLIILGSDAFQLQTLAALGTLVSVASGREILRSIQESGHSVTIQETKGADGTCPASQSVGDTADATRGTESIVFWNPGHATAAPAGPQEAGADPAAFLGTSLGQALRNGMGTIPNGPSGGEAHRTGLETPAEKGAPFTGGKDR